MIIDILLQNFLFNIVRLAVYLYVLWVISDYIKVHWKLNKSYKKKRKHVLIAALLIIAVNLIPIRLISPPDQIRTEQDYITFDRHDQTASPEIVSRTAEAKSQEEEEMTEYRERIATQRQRSDIHHQSLQEKKQ